MTFDNRVIISFVLLFSLVFVISFFNLSHTIYYNQDILLFSSFIKTINLEDIKKIAIKAGNAVMQIYNRDFEVEYKDDNSPLTKADLASHDIIVKALERFGLPIMSEESMVAEYETRKNWKQYWCIDPIDGTKEFVKKNGEFTVNIALIENNTPILGVVYAPVQKDMYVAKRDEGAFKLKINDKGLTIDENQLPINRSNSDFVVVASKSHLNKETKDFINQLKIKHSPLNIISKGSSLKLCMVAEGKADIYPRLSPTMEWDTAAAHAIVLESGKKMLQFKSKEEIIYNKKNLLNPWFIVK